MLDKLCEVSQMIETCRLSIGIKAGVLMKTQLECVSKQGQIYLLCIITPIKKQLKEKLFEWLFN